MRRGEDSKGKEGVGSHTPTPEMRKKVRMLGVAGYSMREMGEILGVTAPVLEKYYGKEVRESRAETVSAVASTLVRQALAGNVQCMMFYLKTQGGWRESAPVKEVPDTKPVYQLYSAPLKSSMETIEYIKQKGASIRREEKGPSDVEMKPYVPEGSDPVEVEVLEAEE